MGTFREITVRPDELPEVSVEPDGTVEIAWVDEGMTILLSPGEAQFLAAELVSASLIPVLA